MFFLTDRLNKMRTKLIGTRLITFPDYTMLSNQNHRAKLKIESQRCRNTKDENLVLPKE